MVLLPFPRFHRGLRTYGPAALNTATGIRTIRFLARQGLSLEPIDLSMGLLMGPSLVSSDVDHYSLHLLPCISHDSIVGSGLTGLRRV